MIYRKLRPEETTIQAGDVIAAAFHARAVGESVQSQVGGTAFVLRPIPDEPEDVVRVEAEITSYPAGSDEHMMIRVKASAWPRVIPGQHITLLIPRPDPPEPKCPYCGMELTIKDCAAGYWAECAQATCAVVVQGKTCSTRREAIEAMTPKGGGQ